MICCSDVGELGPPPFIGLLLINIAAVGRPRMIVVIIIASSAGLLDLELGDVGLVAVGHGWHALLLVLLVGGAPSCADQRLGPVGAAALLKIVRAVRHSATAVGRVEGPHAVIGSDPSGERALLAGHQVLAGGRHASCIDAPTDLTRVARRAQRRLLGHPVGSRPVRRVRSLGTCGSGHGPLRRRGSVVVTALKRGVTHFLAGVKHGRLLEGERVSLHHVVLQRARHRADIAAHVATGLRRRYIGRVRSLLLLGGMVVRTDGDVAAVLLLEHATVVVILVLGEAARPVGRGAALGYGDATRRVGVRSQRRIVEGAPSSPALASVRALGHTSTTILRSPWVLRAARDPD